MNCEVCEKSIEKNESRFKTNTGVEHLLCHNILSWAVDNPKIIKRISDGVNSR